jgi:lysophospholipid hydrolase
MFPGTKEENTKSGLSGYLDEFLSAIKIFGYLERPVFHELTRSMQTRQLIAGETFNLEEEKGFCIVVDGLVDIFVKSRQQDASSCSAEDLGGGANSDDDDPTQGIRYQLLTEVRNASPMSSLFSIMSLFTEDVNIQPPEDESTLHTPAGSVSYKSGTFPRSTNFDPSSGMSYINGAVSESPVGSPIEPHSTQPIEHSEHRAPHYEAVNSRIPHMSLDGPPRKRANRPSQPRRVFSMSAHPDVIARATVDTTIAIIPASAFRRLIKVYPKATAHIVHLILSRFQRITLATAYNYLDLRGEVLQTEKNMIRYATCQLPNMLRGDPLTRLKEKFSRERERVGDDEIGKGIALHNAAAGRPRPSKTNLRKEASLQAMIKQRPVSSLVGQASGHSREATPHSPSPGDLLTNVHFARNGGRPDAAVPKLSTPLSDSLKREIISPLEERTFDLFNTQKRLSFSRRDSLDEGDLFRVSVLECMFKALGFGVVGSNLREPESTEASPMLVSFDQKRSTAAFSNTANTANTGTSNVFGFMGAFEGADGETESMASGSAAAGGQPNAHALAVDVKDELEIVFFQKGSVLVEQGERNPGLYYVIDGFLDMCTSSDESSAEILADGSSGRRSLHVDPFASSSDSSPFPGEAFDFGKSREKGQRKPQGRQNTKQRRSIALIKPGGLAGYVGSVSSYRSFIDVVAKTDVFVGFLPRSSLERIVDRYPIALLTMAKRLTNLLPRLLLHIDFALEWVQVNAGQVLFHEDDESEAIYIVLNGRLRLVTDKKGGGVKARAEYGQGESVGELEVLTESTRPGTLHAIRDTELVKFPRTLFNSLAQEHPNITIKISKIIASRMRALVDDPSQSAVKDSHAFGAFTRAPSSVNLRTVAILPVASGVPVVEFGNRLMAALAQVGVPNGATSLNQAAILKHLGKHAFNKMGKLRLSQYLADLEEKYGLVVYVAGKL